MSRAVAIRRVHAILAALAVLAFIAAMAVASGAVRPIVEATLPLEDVARAHRAMEQGGHAGKFVLTL